MLLFLEEYFVDFSAKNAAIRAGYSPRIAAQYGYHLLRHPGIAPEVAKRLGGLRTGIGIGRDEALLRLAALVRDPATPVEQRVRILLFVLKRSWPGPFRRPMDAGEPASAVRPLPGRPPPPGNLCWFRPGR